MKKLCLIVSAFLSVSCLQAQDAPAPAISAPQNTNVSTEKTTPTRAKPQQKVATPTNTKGWQTTGLIYEMSEKGLVVISPTAPAKMGCGTKALIPAGTPTAPATRTVNANDRVVDGIVLIGWSW